MSIHSSLRGVSTLKGERSVLKRMERILALKKEGKFDESAGSIYGLPKVRTKFKVAGAKKKKAAKEPEAGAATPAPEASAPTATKGAKAPKAPKA